MNGIQDVIDLRVFDLNEILKSLHCIKSEAVSHPYIAVHLLFAVIRLSDSILLSFFNLISYSQVIVKIIDFANIKCLINAAVFNKAAMCFRFGCFAFFQDDDFIYFRWQSVRNVMTVFSSVYARIFE